MKSSFIFCTFALVLCTSLVQSIPNPGNCLGANQCGGSTTEYNGHLEQILQCRSLAVNVDGSVMKKVLTEEELLELFQEMPPVDLEKIVQSGKSCGAVGLRYGGVTKIKPISSGLVNQVEEILNSLAENKRSLTRIGGRS